YINDLSMNVNLEETLQDAEILYRRFEHFVESVDAQRRGQNEGSQTQSSTGTTSTTSTAPEISPILRNLLRTRS
ncbi:hypothetical protein BGZ65_006607, partial [Modicella reniformis]